MPTLSPEAIASLRAQLERIDGDTWTAQGVMPKVDGSLHYLVLYEDGEVRLHTPEHAEFVAASRNAMPALLDAAESHATLIASVAKFLAWNPEQAGSADLREALHRHRMGLIEALATLDRSAK